MPVEIISLEENYKKENCDIEKLWMSETGLSEPEYCSVLKCVEKSISYCRVRMVSNVNAEYLIPLCKIHSASDRVSEVYDFHLAVLPCAD